MFVDFHIHTRNSDGQEELSDIIRAAQQQRMGILAITDHNHFTLKKNKIIPGKKNLILLPGCEFSCMYQLENGNIEIHCLGIFSEVNADYFQKKYFNQINKIPYLEAIIDQLNLKLGFSISMEDILEEKSLSSHIGRPHIARALVKKGYVSTVEDAMNFYIGDRSKYYLSPCDFIDYQPLEEVVKDIQKQGGIPILAHPFYRGFQTMDVVKLVRDFKSCSINDSPMSMEVFYKAYSEVQRRTLLQIAGNNTLVPSISSDRHHPGNFQRISGSENYISQILEYLGIVYE